MSVLAAIGEASKVPPPIRCIRIFEKVNWLVSHGVALTRNAGPVPRIGIAASH